MGPVLAGGVSPFPGLQTIEAAAEERRGDARIVSDSQRSLCKFWPHARGEVYLCPSTPYHFFRKGSFHVTAQGARLGKTAKALPRCCVCLFQLLAKAFL